MDTTASGSHPSSPGRFAFQPGQAFGSYVIERELARGGQGAIVVARHAQLGTPVALKLLLQGDERSRSRFLREAQVLARLKHPHVPAVHHMGEHQGVAFMAMELIQGEDLHRRISARGVPAPAWAARVMADVARVVQACHEQGILHRDLKPHNVLIEAGTERPVLVDFGLLKKDETVEGGLTVDGGTLSLAGELKGTPAYMAPEQADASLGEVGRATDVYALGATLYHLLTGQPPYQGSTNYNIITNLLKASRPPDPRQAEPAVPASLAEVCLAAMALEPGQRIASAGELAVQLDQAADALEGKAPPPRKRSPSRAPLLTSALVALGGLGAAVAIVASARAPGPSPSASVPATPARALPVALTVKGAAGELRVLDAVGALAYDAEHRPLDALTLPAELSLYPGGYTLELRVSGHHPSRTPVTLASDAPQDLTLGPGPDEVAFRTLSRRGLAGRPLIADLDGQGPLDVVVHCWLGSDNSAEAVGYSGADGAFLWSSPGPVNRYASATLRTRNGHVSDVIVSQIEADLPVVAVLSSRTGKRRDPAAIPLDSRGPYRREPLTPIPLDVEGTGARGYAVVCDLNGDQPAFVGLCLREPGEDYAAPILPDYWREPFPAELDDHALFVTPLAPRGGEALLWYYRGLTLLLSVPEGQILDRLRPARAPLKRGALEPPAPSELGALYGWSLSAEANREAIELGLFGADRRPRWQRIVAEGTRAGAGRCLTRLELEPQQPRLYLATSRAGLLILDEASGDELGRIAPLSGPLGDPQLVRHGGRRLLGVAANVKLTKSRETPADYPRYVLLDPARDFAVVWERELPCDYYRFVVAADLDQDGDDELLTTDVEQRLVVIRPAPR